jgi:hypothetical protein
MLESTVVKLGAENQTLADQVVTLETENQTLSGEVADLTTQSEDLNLEVASLRSESDKQPVVIDTNGLEVGTVLSAENNLSEFTIFPEFDGVPLFLRNTVAVTSVANLAACEAALPADPPRPLADRVPAALLHEAPAARGFPAELPSLLQPRAGPAWLPDPRPNARSDRLGSSRCE